MRRRKLFQWLVFTGILANSLPAFAGSVPDWVRQLWPAFERIGTHNPGVGAQAEQAAAVRRAATAAGALPDPMLGLGMQAVPMDGSLTREPMTQAPVVTLQQAIPFPGRLRASAAAMRADGDEVDARRRLQIEARALDLAMAAIEAAQVAAEQALVRETLDWMQLLARSAEVRYVSGRGLRQDVEQVRVELGRLQAEQSRLGAMLAGAESGWRAVLGSVPMPRLSQVSADAPARAWAPPDEVTAWALTANPDLQLQQRRRDVAEARLREARQRYAPDLVLELGYGVRHEDRQDFVSGRLAVSVPVWAAWSQRARVEGTQRNLAATDLERADVRQRVEARLDGGLAAWRDADHRRFLYETSVLPDARSARLSAAAAYESGHADIFAPIEAIRRELQSRREYARVVAEQRMAEARLLALAGRLAPVVDKTSDAGTGEQS